MRARFSYTRARITVPLLPGRIGNSTLSPRACGKLESNTLPLAMVGMANVPRRRIQRGSTQARTVPHVYPRVSAAKSQAVLLNSPQFMNCVRVELA